MKTGDFVKVMYGITDPKNKQGEVGRIFRIKPISECTTEVSIIFEDGQMGRYDIECLVLEKECTWEVGKCYKAKNGKFVKVQEFSCWGTILGVRFCHYDGYAKISECGNLNSFFESGQEIEEISEQEFYSELEILRKEFLKNIQKVRDFLKTIV